MYKILANTLFLGKQVIYMPSCHSTNDTALEMVRNTDTIEGTIIITDYQVAGKGQRGNSWESKPGENLTFSVILKPFFVAPSQQFSLNMVVSMAVRATVLDFRPGCRCMVKWPNDVVVENRKIAGILIENSVRSSQIESSVVGIGINVNQTEFGDLNAASLISENGDEIDLTAVLERLMLNLESYYLQLKAGKTAEIKQEYKQHLLGYKTLMRFRSEYEFRGEIVDVDDSGLLSVSVNGQVNRFNFKEIEFLL